MIIRLLKNEKNSLINQISQKEEILKSLPNGNLLCVKNGKYIKWFMSNGINPIYISKKNRQLAEELALKKYYMLQLEILLEKLNLIESYMEYIEQLNNQAEVLLLESTGYKELLNPYFDAHSDPVQEWLKGDYRRSNAHLENLIHSTLSGQLVRSKSEAMIANTLYFYKIPFIYERGIYLNDILFFPDFTILHPKTNKIIYWEHFGLMSNPSYCDNAYHKLKVYANHSIIPTINLITTFETTDHPLDSTEIERLIQVHFL